MRYATRTGRFSTVSVLAAAAALAFSVAASAQSTTEGAFDRTLKVAGQVELSVRTGAGSVRVTPGPGDSVRVSGRIRADNSWLAGDVSAQIRQIEKNPPVEQSGNTIKVGFFPDDTLTRHLSISYDITVPAETSVNARSGSGSVTIGDLKGAVDVSTGSGAINVGRVGGAVSASAGSGSIEVAGAASLNARTGSGGIKATAIAGAAKASSGSGGVHVEQSGKGELNVSASSGEISVIGVDGPAKVSSSSGGIRLEGRPSAPWHIDSSSGTVTLRIPADASFDLDAEVSSGHIDSAHPVTMEGRMDRRRLQGKVRGGGPLVEVNTSSGGIRIQ